MSEPMTISSTRFARNFAEIRDQIRELGVVKVENHSRLVGAFLSPRELENYERFKKYERKVYGAGEMPEHLVDALEATLKALDDER